MTHSNYYYQINYYFQLFTPRDYPLTPFTPVQPNPQLNSDLRK